jgi:NAD(P)-dependent dehydrogenase (short-subunit alcohol dehydrogenase family)
MHPALTEGRAAVITGGASGIGLAAAKRFASLGMKICLADLSQDALDRAEAEMPGATVVTVPTDVSKMDEVLRLKGSWTREDTQMPPGSARPSSRAATFTPSPKMSSFSTTMSP